MDQSFPLYPIGRGRELIAQIRRDIAAAWEQLEAGRAILERSGWLIARWREQARAPSIVAELGSGRIRPSVAGMYIEVKDDRRPARRRPRRSARSRSKEPQPYPVA